jgi:hypothetical protein
MKTFFMIAGVAIAGLAIVIVILGYLFISWANKPENVAAMKKEYETEAAQKVQDEKEQADMEKDMPAAC